MRVRVYQHAYLPSAPKVAKGADDPPVPPLSQASDYRRGVSAWTVAPDACPLPTADRETDCCSFFDFTLHVRADQLELTVDVPTRFSPILAGMSDQADAMLGRS